MSDFVTGRRSQSSGGDERRGWLIAASLALAATCLSVPAHAQVGATLVGSITDSAGWEYVGKGAGVGGNNSPSLTAALPANTRQGDLLVILAYARGSTSNSANPMSPDVPSGWSEAARYDGGLANGGHIAVFYKVHDGTESDTAVTFSGTSAAGSTELVQMAAFRGNDTTSPLGDVGADSFWAAAQNIGPISAVTLTNSSQLLLVFAARQNDMNANVGGISNNVATLTGDGQTWNEIEERGETLGNDAGYVWDYAFTAGTPTITAKTFTNGDAQTGAGAGLMVAFKASTGESSYAFPSATYSNGRLYIAYTNTSGATTAPTVTGVSGAGLIFTEIGTAGGVTYGNPTTSRRIQAWRAMVPSGATTGPVTITLDGPTLGFGASMVEFTGTKTTGTNGADAVVQSATATSGASNVLSLTATLAAFASSANRPVAFFGHAANEATTPEGTHTELHDGNTGNPAMGYQTEWLASGTDTTPSASWTTSSRAGAFALEIAAGTFEARKALTIDYTKVTPCGSNLSNFPVLVSLTGNYLKTRANGGRIYSANGYDIEFRDSGGVTKLDHEIEKYDPVAGTLVAWVEVPTVSRSANTTFYMYYGNPGITTNQSNPTGVWDANYLAVWHLKEDPSITNCPTNKEICDSTSNARHGDMFGTMGSGAQVAGRIAGSLSFDGTDDRIDIGSIVGNRTAFTVSLWFRSSSTAGPNKMWGEGSSTTGTPLTYLDLNEAGNAGDVEFAVRDDGSTGAGVGDAGPWNNNQWHQMVGVQSSKSARQLFVDGTTRGTDATTVGTVTLNTGNIGAINHNGIDQYFPGGIDEVRISSTNRSACWVGTEYNNQSNPGSDGSPGFYTVGTEDPLVPTLTLADHASGQVPDRFTYVSPVTDVLFHFRLTRDLAATANNIRVNLTTAGGVANGDVTDGELWRDDGDGVFEGAGQDTQLKDNVGPAVGVIAFNGLAEDPGTSGTTYFVRVTVANLVGGDTTTLSVGIGDIDVGTGIVRSGSATNATHTQETVLYRSVGTTATNLNTSSRTVEISGTTATFSGPMPANLGVGDVLQYPTGGPYYLAVIHGRVSDTVYTVYSTAGGTPQAAAAGTAVGVYRAYTRLFNWEALDENDTLDNTVEDFDTLASANLVASNRVMNVACYGDAPDTTAVTISGWTTSATNYIRIFTPTSAVEVGTSQRHPGYYDTGKYLLRYGGEVLRISDNYVRVDGLQVHMNADVVNAGGIVFSKGSDTGNSDYEVSNSLVRGPGTGSQNTRIGINLYSAGSGTLRAWNNIVYNWVGTGTRNTGILPDDATYGFYLYDNTVVDCGWGIEVGNGTVVAKNNLVSSNTDNYNGTFSGLSTNNLSGPSQADAPGSNPRNAATVTFVSYSGDDFHLAAADTGARGYGADLSADANLAFAVDIDGAARSGLWDIGADEWAAPGTVAYSIGTSTADLKTGSPTVSITAGLATLSDPQTGHVGVGDLVDYDSTNETVFIASVVSPTQFTVRTATGGVPPDSGAVSVNSVKRAFNTIGDAVTGSGDAGHLGTFDLVAANVTLLWVCYNDGPFAETVTIDGYTTDATRFATLTVAGAQQVASGVSQRHDGTAGTGAVLRPPNGVLHGISVEDAYTVVEWLDVDGVNGMAVNADGVQAEAGGQSAILQNLIIHGLVASHNGIYTSLNGVVIRNCVIYDNFGAIQIDGTNNVVQNVTIYSHSGYGLMSIGNGSTIENVVSMNSVDDFMFSGAITASNNNMSSDATADDSPGTGNLINRLAANQFRSLSGGYDLHLKGSANAIGAGKNLSGSFTDDIDGVTRPAAGAWDIGADEVDALTQGHYRWRHDNGTQATAGWAAAEDTVLSGVPPLATRRLRFEVSNEGAVSSGAVSYQLQYARSSTCSTATYSPVPAEPATGEWQIVDTWNFGDQDPTTNVAGGVTDDGSSFVAGYLKDAGNYNTTGITLNPNQFTEVEFNLRPTATAVAGANYCFRLYHYSGLRPLDTYLTYASAIVAAPSAMRVRTGSYAGDGVNGRAINVGFQPDLVILEAANTHNAIVRTSTMSGNTSRFLKDSAALVDRIQAFSASGFTVGNQAEANANGLTYHWVAFQSGAGDMAVGSYQGDTLDNRNVNGLGFQPEYVLLIPDPAAGYWTWHRFADSASGDSQDVEGGPTGPPRTNRIQDFLGDGFQVGNDVVVNGNSVNLYHWIAWNEVPGRIDVGSYAGNGNDNRSITGVGFRPEYLLLAREVTDSVVHKPASSGVATDLSQPWRGYTQSMAADRVQALEADGFQLGQSTLVNASGAGNTYYYAAFGPYDPAPAVYYSIGTSTADLKTGGPTIAIVSGVATLSVAQTGNVGVGDVIEYDSPSQKAYIASVVSQAQFTVRTATGGIPADTGAVVVTSIKRAFNTVAAAVTGSADANHLGTYDLPAARVNLTWVGYNDGLFAAGATIDGYTTSPANVITLTVAGASQVASGVSQRHDGVRDTGTRINGPGTSAGALLIRDGNVTVEWWAARNTKGCIACGSIDVDGATNVLLRNLVLYDTYNGVYSRNGASLTLRNSIVFNADNDGFLGSLGTTATIESCTFYAAANGVNGGGGTTTVRNTVSMGNGLLDFASVTTQAYNLSEDVSASGPGSFQSAVGPFFTFASTATPDLHLRPGSEGVNAGLDLSATFSDDIDGGTRPFSTAWDIGADESLYASNHLLLENHALGQADAFATTSPVTGVLSRFRMTRSGTVTVNTLRVRFSTGGGIANGDVASGELWQDANGNGTLETGSDTLIEGGVVPAGGVLTFTTDFIPPASATTFFVRATVSNLVAGDTTTVSLGTADVDTLQAGITESGSVADAIHAQDQSSGADVYYSVGTSSPTDLKTGAPTITVVNGTATLSVAQVGNVGVGDRITFTGGPVFIEAVLSPTVFVVHTATGAIPADVPVAVSVTSIRREFASIAAAESGSPALLGGSSDLVATSRRLTWVVYNDGPLNVSANTTINGYTAGAANYITLTVAGASQVASGASQRHTGIAGTGAVVEVTAAVNENVLTVAVPYTRVEWLELDGNDFIVWAGVQVEATGSNALLRHLLIHDVETTGSQGDGFGMAVDGDGTVVRNCIVYEYGEDGIYVTSNGVLVQNTTLHRSTNTSNVGEALQVGSGCSAIAENVIATDSSFYSEGSLTCYNSISSGNSVTTPPGCDGTGTGNQTNRSAASLFVSAVSGYYDLHLRSGSAARDTGLDLSATRLFADDIDGQARPYGAAWDVGADEAGPSTALRLQVLSGTYDGDGTDDRAITVGFQPDLVIVDSEGTAAGNDVIVRTSTMVGDASKAMDDTVVIAANQIQSLTPTGFTVGTDPDVNEAGAGRKFHWVAMQAGAGVMKVGKYTGSGTASQAITGLGFTPVYVLVIPEDIEYVIQRSVTMPTVWSMGFSSEAWDTNITALRADGFVVGTRLNTSSVVYHYAAWAAVPGSVMVGSYLGNNTDNRDISGTGFMPEYVAVTRAYTPGQLGGQGSAAAHKPASTGTATDGTLLFDARINETTNVKALLPDGFRVGTHARVNSSTAPSTYHWAAFGPHATRAYYRSVGNTGTVVGPGASGLDVVNGSTQVDAPSAQWVTNDRGRGDVITIAGVNYMVQTVASETRLYLSEAYQGATGNVASGQVQIRRQFATLADWESCIDGDGGALPPAGPCYYFRAPNPSLVTDDRSEVGIVYNDGTAYAGGLTIDGSVTDAAHTITLTADRGHRHSGVASPGATTHVVVDNGSSTSPAIQVLDDHVTVEWLEVKGGSGTGADLVSVNNLATGANEIFLRYNLLHDGSGHGIHLRDVDTIATVSNNIVFNNIRHDVALGLNGAGCGTDVRLLSNTVYGGSQSGIKGASCANQVQLTNNIACSGGRVGGYYDIDFSDTSPSDGTFDVRLPDSGYNLTCMPSPKFTGSNGVYLDWAEPGFVSTFNPVDLHLTSSSPAVDQGTNLSTEIGYFDVDGQSRVATWDIGADEYNGFTAVKLVDFRAAALDAAVSVEWETAQELDNLGFHLYRGASADGPWTRLNATLIPGLGSSPEGKAYVHLDSGLANGTTYFYRLEDVDRHGIVTSHGPVSATPQVGGEPGDGGGGDGGGPEEPPPSPRTTPKASWKPHGEPEKQSLRVLERSAEGVTLELVTGGFYSEEQPDGTTKLIVPGFFDRSEPGRPTVPTRRLWQDALVGRGVELVDVAPSDFLSFSGLRVPVAGRPVAVATPEGTYEASSLPVSAAEARKLRAADTATGLFPAAQALVHQTAFQGERKKAYVELSPLRVNETTQRVTLARRLVVRLAFAGAVEGERGKGSVGRRAPSPGASDAATGTDPQVLARFATRARGLHAVTFEEVPGLTGALATSSLLLSRRGVPVPFHCEPRTASFGPGSTLYFLSDGTDSAYGSEAVFELALGSDGIAMPVAVASARRVTTTTPIATLRHEGSFEADLNYLPALTEARDLWVWDYGLAGGQGQDYAFTAHSPALVPENAQLRVDLEGGSDTLVEEEHHLLAFVNGSLVGDLRFDGMQPAILEAEVPTSLLRDGSNTLRLENAGDTGSTASFVYLDRFSLEYARPVAPLAGVLEGKASQAGRASIEAAPGAILLDTTDPTPRFLGRALGGGRLTWNAEPGHRYLATFPEAFQKPEVRAASAGTLRAATNQADWIVVAPEALLPAAQDLAAHREAQGLAAMVVSLEDVVVEFGHGEAGPHAVRDFLAFAFHHWAAPSPRYVLLLGDASYDPKGFLSGTSRPDLIPTPYSKSAFLWTPADPLYAAVNGTDSLPDIAIGRINAATLAEAQAAVQKILDFENASRTLGGNAALVADNPDLAGDFEANQDGIATLLPSRPVQKIYLTQLGASATKAAVRNAFDSGASLVSFVGHGSSGLWATEGILRSPDVAFFAPQPQQPFVLTMTCSNGYFASPYNNSLSERLVLAADKGAIASFSPSGLSVDAAAHVFHSAVVSELELGGHDRLGDLVLAAQADYAASGAFPELLDFYNLLGDPGLRIR